MNTVLVPFDGSEASVRALQFVIRQPQASRPQQVHVINAQDWPLAYGEYMTASGIQMIREAQLEQGRTAVAMAERLLLDTGIPFKSHVIMGNVAHAIVDQAEQLGCDQIVMATRGSGALKGLVLGSIATQVVHLSKLPVTLVK